MRRSLLILLAVAAPLAAQQQQGASASNAAVSAVKMNWQMGHNYVLRAAEQVPDSLYAFAPVAGVRNFGQIVAHVAGAQYMFCAMVLGETPKAEDNIEKSQTTKAGIVAALKASGEYCDKAYAAGDADASAMISVFGQQRSKLFALTMNATHDMEHYGNLVTYMRIKGLTPPSSQR